MENIVVVKNDSGNNLPPYAFSELPIRLVPDAVGMLESSDDFSTLFLTRKSDFPQKYHDGSCIRLWERGLVFRVVAFEFRTDGVLNDDFFVVVLIRYKIFENWMESDNRWFSLFFVNCWSMELFHIQQLLVIFKEFEVQPQLRSKCVIADIFWEYLDWFTERESEQFDTLRNDID